MKSGTECITTFSYHLDLDLVRSTKDKLLAIQSTRCSLHELTPSRVFFFYKAIVIQPDRLTVSS